MPFAGGREKGQQMNDDEHSCLLRRLTLCDGQVAAGLPPRALDAPCYCETLALQENANGGLEGQRLRIERARVIASASVIERIRRRRLPPDW